MTSFTESGPGRRIELHSGFVKRQKLHYSHVYARIALWSPEPEICAETYRELK